MKKLKLTPVTGALLAVCVLAFFGLIATLLSNNGGSGQPHSQENAAAGESSPQEKPKKLEHYQPKNPEAARAIADKAMEALAPNETGNIDIIALPKEQRLGIWQNYEANEITFEPELGPSDNWKEAVFNLIRTSGSVVSVYYHDLETGEEFIIDDQPIYPSCTIKLYVMGAVYSEIEAGRLEQTEEIDQNLFDMINWSSNDAYNELVLALGKGDFAKGATIVNDFAYKHGYVNTRVRHSLHPSEQKHMVLENTGKNYTTASDSGHFLVDLYNKRLVSERADSEMIDLLLGEIWDYTGVGVPYGVPMANKTGDTIIDGWFFFSDSVIVYRDSHPYVLSVLMRCDNKWDGPWLMAEIGSFVYSGSTTAVYDPDDLYED